MKNFFALAILIFGNLAVAESKTLACSPSRPWVAGDKSIALELEVEKSRDLYDVYGVTFISVDKQVSGYTTTVTTTRLPMTVTSIEAQSANFETPNAPTAPNGPGYMIVANVTRSNLFSYLHVGHEFYECQ